MKRSRPRGGVRIVFAVENGRRSVTVGGSGLAEAERRQLRQLVRPLAIRTGVVTIKRDWLGRLRVTCSRDIPEPMQQVVRNLVGNLSRLRTL
ncbi:MAG: hypothetical protein B6D46_16375 [Polyangiaceae bacterium UTPRO1]|nr:hypothetical protein [Myxococcales bacterium]OQY64678.1 MAG: hypothetical protein B6D46_16375 [Polyangiaceae bacterium UTPRO1]